MSVTEFRVEGNRAVDTEAIDAILDPLEGREFDLAGLREVADRVTELHAERGLFLARAVLPAQEIRDGVVRIRVIEGRVGSIHVDDNRNYSDAFIRRHIEAGLADGARRRGLERALLVLNEDVPELRVTTVLESGSEPGTVDVRAQVEDDAPVRVSLLANNFGSESVSRYRYGARVDWTNALFDGDQASLTGLVGNDPSDLTFVSARYAAAVDTAGTRVGFSASTGNFEVPQDFRQLGLEGELDSFGLFVSRPLIRRPGLGLVAEFGTQYKDSTLEALGTTASRDRVRLVHGSLALDSSWMNGRSFAELKLVQGLGGEESDNLPPSRLDGDNVFTKAHLSLARIQRLGNRFTLLARVSGQASSESLLAVEEWQIGGVGSVRGFAPGEVAGDHGYQASLELRANPLEDRSLLSLVGFIDHGRAFRRSVVVGQDRSAELTGAGVGIRVDLSGKVPEPALNATGDDLRSGGLFRAALPEATLRLDVAWPLEPADNSLDEDPALYGSVVLRF